MAPNDNALHLARGSALADGMTLDSLTPRLPHRVIAINWAALPDGEGHRLRSLGLEEGAVVELLHRGMLFWRDPLAVRIGRMTVAMRKKNAAAVSCAPIAGLD